MQRQRGSGVDVRPPAARAHGCRTTFRRVRTGTPRSAEAVPARGPRAPGIGRRASGAGPRAPERRMAVRRCPSTSHPFSPVLHDFGHARHGMCSVPCACARRRGPADRPGTPREPPLTARLAPRQPASVPLRVQPARRVPALPHDPSAVPVPRDRPLGRVPAPLAGDAPRRVRRARRHSGPGFPDRPGPPVSETTRAPRRCTLHGPGRRPGPATSPLPF